MSKKNAQTKEIEQLPAVAFIAKVTMKSKYPNIFRLRDYSFTIEIRLSNAAIAEEFIQDCVKHLPMSDYIDWAYDLRLVGSADSDSDIITDPNI